MKTKKDELARRDNLTPIDTPQPASTNQKAAHTPGPWDDASKYDIVDSVRIFAGTHYIGTIGNSDDTRAQTQANARLIAAAPDLLAVAVEAENWLDNHGGGPDDDPGLRGLLAMLRAAIAKAVLVTAADEQDAILHNNLAVGQEV